VRRMRPSNVMRAKRGQAEQVYGGQDRQFQPADNAPSFCHCPAARRFLGGGGGVWFVRYANGFWTGATSVLPVSLDLLFPSEAAGGELLMLLGLPVRILYNA
jgi:hypothetical protein